MSEKIKIEKELLSPPGDDILETIDSIKMTQAELADRLAKTTSKVSDIISGKEPITYNTALQLEKVLGIDAQYWLNREMNYRTKLARIDGEEAMEKNIEWLKQQPVRLLKKLGFLKEDRKETKLVAETFEFYGVVNIERWENRYVAEYSSVSYRKSETVKATLGSMAAWLRVGEIGMQKLRLPEYDKDDFKKALDDILKIVETQPGDFVPRLQKVCAASGVGVIFTPCFPKAPVAGATRWFRTNPLIQMTDRHKTNDHFWFTFFHEAGHVMLHGRKEKFLEGFEGFRSDKEKEEEANRFAAKYLLPEKFKGELPSRISQEDIKSIARKYHTHPGIVVGRLQHDGFIKHSFANELKAKIDLFSF